MVIETRSPRETFEFGKKIGELAKTGESIPDCDLGVGKAMCKDWQRASD
ncbi:MAG: hypothetical protein ACLTCI_13240 [[Clostridium] nexile]